jgi:hypothetical protein
LLLQRSAVDGGWWDAASCDPGGQQVVRVLGQMVADEGVEKVAVASQMCLRERDELAFADRAGQRTGTVQQRAPPAHQRRRHEDRGGVRSGRQGPDLDGGTGVAAYQAPEQGIEVIGHRTTMANHPDDPLTAG